MNSLAAKGLSVFNHGDIVIEGEMGALVGYYKDELSAYRAKRAWPIVLLNTFLLTEGEDYTLVLQSDFYASSFILCCIFHSPCGKYVLWRLAEGKSQEVFYCLKNSYVPSVSKTLKKFAFENDIEGLLKMFSESAAKEKGLREESRCKLSYFSLIKSLFGKMLRRNKES